MRELATSTTVFPTELLTLGKIPQLVISFSNIERAISHPTDPERMETDTEHSYSLAMLAWYLAPKIDPSLDVNKVLKRALVHDIVEVYAGDTTVWAPPEVLATKAEREHAALLKLREEYADFPEMIESIEAYEAKSDPESGFVYVLDKIIALIMIISGGGHSWKQNGITFEMHQARHYELDRRIAQFDTPLQDEYRRVLNFLEQNREHYFAT